MLTNRHGAPLHPGFLTHRIAALICRRWATIVRLHDLRHGAATLAHLAGADLKTIQDQLGYSSIVLTADTYTSVLPAMRYKAAEAIARLVLDAARRDRDKIAAVARRTGVKRMSKSSPPSDRRQNSQRRSSSAVARPAEAVISRDNC